MVSGLVFIKGLLANMLENMPDPRLNQAAWEAMWCEYPVQWKSALRRARRLAGEDQVLAADVLRASGLEVPEDAADTAEDEERSIAVELLFPYVPWRLIPGMLMAVATPPRTS